MGDWSAHGTSYYNCNRYEEKSGKDARDGQQKSRVSLERYLHVRVTFGLMTQVTNFNSITTVSPTTNNQLV